MASGVAARGKMMLEDVSPSADEPVGATGAGGLAIVALAPALLAACGDGTGSGTAGAGTAPGITVAAASVTPVQASRFLAQSTMGATRTMVDALVARGFDGWLTDQFALPRATTHWDWLVANGYGLAANVNGQAGYDATVWRQLIAEPDQLRQRVGMALLDLMVVGIDGINTNWRAFNAAAYLDVLMDGAFGNFRALMGAITTSAAMGSFLTFLNNRKANAATGSQPDENYARELMQLFTLGLYKLNMDGTLIGGATPVETYTQADVSGLARVFTGLSLASTSTATPDVYRQPLVMNAAVNETGSASFLGTSVTGGGMAAVNAALDAIFAHGNIAPFVSKQLIQRLVSSNPSPGYVARVAAVFADNGKGVRGDMQAVLRAILLDTEARSDASLATTTGGKLREPITRLTGWARAYGAASPSAAWAIGDTSSSSTRLGQSPGRAQTVFNFFRPGYSPPNTAISAAGLVAPEFQLANEQTVVGTVNYLQALIANGAGDVKADYTAILAKAGDSAALVDEVNVVLAAGQLSATTVASIRTAVDSVATTATGGPTNRVGIAILLTLASPDYLTLR
ncbi:DUF1800 domain-containing protein [Sphingomonas bacterium]|uniref:DUF1800 domain-containing protein n=1 Tax=Sphingomonas bacterium TaxID=1895847 RepID=UPI0015753C59|nr:DUF1800 domain-containing protein [Sphingomonas bacterium]